MFRGLIERLLAALVNSSAVNVTLFLVLPACNTLALQTLAPSLSAAVLTSVNTSSAHLTYSASNRNQQTHRYNIEAEKTKPQKHTYRKRKGHLSFTR
ncbi:MAG: hypothetical protein QXW32_07645 [Nitrososphaerales archaeon]